MTKNYCVKFAKRPGVHGTPKEDHFTYEECEYPELTDDTNAQFIIKSLYVSVDPIQRNQMNEDTGLPIFPSFQIGKVIPGLFGVGVVVESQDSNFKPGNVVINSVLNGWPWQLYFKTTNVEKKFAVVDLMGDDPKYEVTYYGLTGLTTLIGLQEQGNILENNGKGKSFVVSGAAGSCGHLAGQFALLNGCNPVIGICGTDEKCQILRDKLKYTGTINYKVENVNEKLKQLCPNGVDVYFDNVGGKVAEAVLMNMNQDGNIVLCGQISSYNSDEEYPQVLPDGISAYLKNRNIKREAFVSVLHVDKFEKAREELHRLKRDDGIQVLDTVHVGLEKISYAFCSMMKGKNVGKQLVKVSDL